MGSLWVAWVLCSLLCGGGGGGEERQLVTSCVYLAELLHLPWLIRHTQISQSSVTWLSPGHQRSKGANNYNDKSLLPGVKDVSSCGQHAVNSNSHYPSGGTQTRFCPAEYWICSFALVDMAPTPTTLQL